MNTINSWMKRKFSTVIPGGNELRSCFWDFFTRKGIPSPLTTLSNFIYTLSDPLSTLHQNRIFFPPDYFSRFLFYFSFLHSIGWFLGWESVERIGVKKKWRFWIFKLVLVFSGNIFIYSNFQNFYLACK